MVICKVIQFENCRINRPISKVMSVHRDRLRRHNADLHARIQRLRSRAYGGDLPSREAQLWCIVTQWRILRFGSLFLPSVVSAIQIPWRRPFAVIRKD